MPADLPPTEPDCCPPLYSDQWLNPAVYKREAAAWRHQYHAAKAALATAQQEARDLRAEVERMGAELLDTQQAAMQMEDVLGKEIGQLTAQVDAASPPAYEGERVDVSFLADVLASAACTAAKLNPREHWTDICIALKPILRAHLQPPTAPKPAAGGEEIRVHVGERRPVHPDSYPKFLTPKESGDEVPVQNQGAGEVPAAQGLGAEMYLPVADCREASPVPNPQPAQALSADDGTEWTAEQALDVLNGNMVPAELDALRADRERLNWLAVRNVNVSVRQETRISCYAVEGNLERRIGGSERKTLREAIDAAKEAQVNG